MMLEDSGGIEHGYAKVEHMNSAIKNEVLHVVEQLPDDADLELVIQALRVRLNIARGIKDLDEGRTVTSQEILERFRAKLST